MMLEIFFFLLAGDAPIIEIDFVVAGNDDFVSKFEGLEEAEKSKKIFRRTVVGEISSMDEDISSHAENWLQFFVTSMCV